MGCITEILKLKGNNKIYIALHEDRPWLVVEGGGIYKYYEYLITFTPSGYRCGYVAIPSGHKLDFVKSEKRIIPGTKKEIDCYEYDAYGINCHGGITFCDRNHGLKDLLEIPCYDLWLGFDCAHAGDGKDMSLVKEYYGENEKLVLFYEKHPEFLHSNDIVREFDYVEKECYSIIDQLITANL
jgi:hypothetical protein